MKETILLQLLFLAIAGGIVGYLVGRLAAGFAEMYYGERVSRRLRRALNCLIFWVTFALCLVGALSIAWN